MNFLMSNVKGLRVEARKDKLAEAPERLKASA
jgi:hypothetical protein